MYRVTQPQPDARPGGPRDSVPVPAEFDSEVAAAQTLGPAAEASPEALRQLIQVYERIVTRLPESPPTAFGAATWNNLGNAYRSLPAEDRDPLLVKAIGCYQHCL